MEAARRHLRQAGGLFKVVIIVMKAQISCQTRTCRVPHLTEMQLTPGWSRRRRKERGCRLFGSRSCQ